MGITKDISTCSACGAGDLGEILFHIPKLPLVDSFKSTRDHALKVPRVDLTMRACSHCGTIQVDRQVSFDVLYRDYIYESSSSPDLEDHFNEYASTLSKLGLVKKSVLEIGINDGLLAKKLIDIDPEIVITGIDPSPQSASINHDQINICNEFFGSTKANEFIGLDKYDLIIANNVFSHIPEMHRVIDIVQKCLKKNGVLVFEVHSTRHLLENCVFDYLYHEHIFCHTIDSLSNLLRKFKMHIFDVSVHPVKGGSFRIFASHHGAYKQSGRYHLELYRDRIVDPKSKATWCHLEKHLTKTSDAISAFFDKITRTSVVGYGASATTTVFQRYFDLEEKLSYIVDDNPKRQGLFTPGYGLDVKSSGVLTSDSNILVLAWRHMKPISKSLKGNVFVPLPYSYYERF